LSKLRQLLKKLRLRSVEPGEGERSVDNVDAIASAASLFTTPGAVGPGAPTNWVPSQQDDRPRH
jgi:hypothetical protein